MGVLQSIFYNFDWNWSGLCVWFFAAEGVVGGRGLKSPQGTIQGIFRAGREGRMPVFVGCTFPLESEFLSPYDLIPIGADQISLQRPMPFP